MTNFLKKSFCLAIAALALTATAWALPASQFAGESRLASGKWVKVAIPTTGVYELTYDELQEMGFANPAGVRVYGNGGNVMSEILDGSAVDDLKAIPVKRFDNKICFYALGPVAFAINRNSNADYFTRTLNTYSTQGYYFLTEETGEELTVLEGTNNEEASNDRSTSIDYFYHEEDLTSPSRSGKVMLGESLLNGNLTFTINNPRINTNAPMAVISRIAALVTDGTATLSNTINSEKVTSYNTSTTFSVPWDSETYYTALGPTGFITPSTDTQGQIELKVGLSGSSLKLGLLDYVVLSYRQDNILPGDDEYNQLRMGITGLNAIDRIMLQNADNNTQVWEVSTPRDPMSFPLVDMGDGTRAFAPNTLASSKMFVAFDPTKTLLKVAGYEAVANQNLHGMATPDMLIITDAAIMDQAQRIADAHHEVDGIDVAVVDQNKVFNEFSSGTPDAMAYRLLCKMLYDRDSNKFKNLLLLGTGSYDNRRLLANQPCSLLAYESDESGEETSTFASDDFFGMLDDNSGQYVARTLLSIGVGRISSRSYEQCKSDVDKLVNYLHNGNYEPWRNNVLVLGDDYDSGLHEFQAEGLNNTIDNNTDSTLVNNRLFVRQYYRPDYASKGEEAGACKQGTEALKSFLESGQYFMTYVGHAGSGGITKKAGLWSSTKVNSTSYANLPIVSMACCNTARWDDVGNYMGLCETMLHKADGGAIAVMSSGRSCLATDNDALNRAFVNALFCYASKGEYTTIGEAYKEAKRSFGTSTNTNKLTFNLLGDPAIRFVYPKELFKVVSLNGTDATDEVTIESGVMQELDIVAHVFKAGTDAIDTDFNGNAAAMIYGPENYDRSLTGSVYTNGRSSTVTRDIHYSREHIATVEGRVVNGVFNGKLVIPASAMVNGDKCVLKMYAHRDNSEDMVNGRYANLVLKNYDESKALADNEAPVIDAIYFSEAPDFASGDIIDANVTLRIEASDDVALNTTRGGVAGTMSLTIDGAASTPAAYDCVVTSNDNKNASLTLPLSGLSAGEHTLQFTIYDASGKMATRNAVFYVNAKIDAALTVATQPAVDEARFDYDGAVDGDVTVRVLDVVGNLVWKADKASFPLTWNLKDLNNKRVPAGVYKVISTTVAGTASAGTQAQELIVVDPLRKSN